jgi:hypothetical protein
MASKCIIKAVLKINLFYLTTKSDLLVSDSFYHKQHLKYIFLLLVSTVLKLAYCFTFKQLFLPCMYKNKAYKR